MADSPDEHHHPSGYFVESFGSMGNLTEKVLPPEDKHSDRVFINEHSEILPGHSSVSSGMNRQRVLSNPTENPERSEKTLVRNRSEPVPPALNWYGLFVEWAIVSWV